MVDREEERRGRREFFPWNRSTQSEAEIEIQGGGFYEGEGGGQARLTAASESRFALLANGSRNLFLSDDMGIFFFRLPAPFFPCIFSPGRRRHGMAVTQAMAIVTPPEREGGR